MTAADLATLAPLIALTAAAVTVMLAAAAHRSHLLALVLTLAGLAVTVAMVPVAAGGPSAQVTPLLRFDEYALFFVVLFAAATAAVALLSWGYLQRRRYHAEEYYALLLSATLGCTTLAAATHFATFFLGLEILSVSLYALIVYPFRRRESVEAAVKYLVLAGATSAFLVFGMALVYAQTGTMAVRGLAPLLAKGFAGEGVVLAVGVALILVGAGFKLAVVPFHMWTPDVYQGAAAPVGAYVATVSKGAMVAVLLRFFAPLGLSPDTSLYVALAGVAIASMVTGNLLALRQDNVKRILGYSSIAHLGYVLVAFLAGGEQAAAAVVFYLVAYFATTLAAFGVVTALSTPRGDADRIDDYRGLAARRPGMTAVFSVALFSLAGMPLTAGFIGKFYIVTAGAGAARWLLVVVLVLTSTMGLYYYTRLIVAMFVSVGDERRATVGAAVAGASAAVLAALTVFVLVVGVYPTWLVDLAERVVAALP